VTGETIPVVNIFVAALHKIYTSFSYTRSPQGHPIDGAVGLRPMRGYIKTDPRILLVDERERHRKVLRMLSYTDSGTTQVSK